MKEINLLDKVALVTGASRGIGASIAKSLADAGAIVIGTATSQAGADKITAAISPFNSKNKGMVLDVTQPESVESVIKAVKDDVGAITILVNNAAITADNIFMRMKDDEWSRVIETNLTSVFRTSKACIRDMMKARFGRIINIGSVVGTTGNPGQVNYSAAKAGVLGLTKSLALEIGSRNITVNAVAPGFISTDMTDALTEEQKQAIFSRIPMQKLGTVDDIAAAVVFLASDLASYITGQTLHVNGGMYMN